MTNLIDQVIADGKWQFDRNVTSCFDNMITRSIPGYYQMRELVFSLGSEFVRPNTWIIDLGCSRGEGLAPFVDRFGAQNLYFACDTSEPMLEATRERFKGYEKILKVENFDLRDDYPFIFSSLTLSVLTLQFVPIEYRQAAIQNVYDHTRHGGAFILVEKVLGSDAFINQKLVSEYYAMKRRHGYTEEQIDSKRKALEGVLVPVTAGWNMELLRNAGFKHVDCFWRHLNFAGFIGIRS